MRHLASKPSVRIPRELHSELIRIACDDRLPLSVVVENALRAFLNPDKYSISGFNGDS